MVLVHHSNMAFKFANLSLVFIECTFCTNCAF